MGAVITAIDLKLSVLALAIQVVLISSGCCRGDEGNSENTIAYEIKLLDSTKTISRISYAGSGKEQFPQARVSSVFVSDVADETTMIVNVGTVADTITLSSNRSFEYEEGCTEGIIYHKSPPWISASTCDTIYILERSVITRTTAVQTYVTHYYDIYFK